MPPPIPPLVKHPNIQIDIPLIKSEDGQYPPKQPFIDLIDQLNRSIREVVQLAKRTPVHFESIRVCYVPFEPPTLRVRLKSHSARVATVVGRRDGFTKIGPLDGRGAELEKHDDSEDWPPDAPVEQAPPVDPVDPTTPPEQEEPPQIDATPRAIQVAIQYDIDLAEVTGTGKDGKITLGDVRAAMDGKN